MLNGQQISERFIHEIIWPLLTKHLGSDAKRLAVAVIGTGSDVQGWDDEISRDHHWGPRANVMLRDEDAATLRPRVDEVLSAHLPREYMGFRVNHGLTIMAGVCCTTIHRFFDYFLGTHELPVRDRDWLRLCETDLLHVTGGVLVIDEAGEMTRRRRHLAFYPETVWKKRIADWCMYLTGRDAPYNLYRMAKRGDQLTGMIYRTLYLKQAMELCFTMNRRYAPYTKWLNPLFRRLPRHADRMVPWVDRIHQENDMRRCVDLMIELNYVIAESLADLGVTAPPVRKPFDEGFTDLTLYVCAAKLYAGLPRELLHLSFNRTELWEKLARDVLFDSRDYFLSAYHQA